EYMKPVNAIALLNAAIASLRKTTNLGPDKLPDIGSTLQEPQAIEMFKQEFAQAAQAAVVPQNELAYTATREMLDSLHDSQVGYYDPMRWAEREQEIAGKPGFVGIGVIIVSRKGSAGDNWLF